MTAGTIASFEELRDSFRSELKAFTGEIATLKEENRKLRAQLRELKAEQEHAEVIREMERQKEFADFQRVLPKPVESELTAIYECTLKGTGKIFRFTGDQITSVLPVLHKHGSKWGPGLFSLAELDQGTVIDERDFTLRRVA